MAGWQQIGLWDYAVQGEYVSHLWFLVNSSVYMLLLAFLGGVLRPWSRQVAIWIGRVLDNISLVLVLFLMPLFSVAILGLNKVGFPLYSTFLGLFNTHSLLVYLPFFVFGAAIAVKRDFIDRFCKSRPTFCVLVIALAAVLVREVPDSGGLLFTVAHTYLLVVVLGALLIYLDVSAVAGWLILVVSVSGIALLIHKGLIARYRVLFFMFNGK